MVLSINWQNSGFQCVYIELIFELAETVVLKKQNVLFKSGLWINHRSLLSFALLSYLYEGT